MRSSACLRTIGIALGLAVLQACSSVAPIAVIDRKGQTYNGTATTTLYTGTFSAGPCTGRFNGPLTGPEVTIAAECADGRRGIGVGRREGSTLVAARIRMGDGSELAIRSGEATPLAGR